MEIVLHSDYVKPFFLDEAGFEGLSSQDIAKSLRVLHHHVTEKILRNEDFLIKSGFHVYTWNDNQTKGRKGKSYFVSTDTAKYLVASWSSNLGAAYFRFLLECERVATNLVPTLAAKLQDAERRVEELQNTIQKPRTLLPKPKTARITQSVVRMDGIMGEPVYRRHMTRVDDKILTPIERLDAKRLNLILQAEGCLRKAKKLEDEIDYLQQPPALRLIKGSP